MKSLEMTEVEWDIVMVHWEEWGDESFANEAGWILRAMMERYLK